MLHIHNTYIWQRTISRTHNFGLYPKTHILIRRKQTIQLKLAKDLNKQVSEYTNGRQAHKRMLNVSSYRKMQRCKLKLQ